MNQTAAMFVTHLARFSAPVTFAFQASSLSVSQSSTRVYAAQLTIMYQQELLDQQFYVRQFSDIHLVYIDT